MPSKLGALWRLAMEHSPAAAHKAERLADEFPQATELYQLNPLAKAIQEAAQGDEVLAITSPETFLKTAAPMDPLSRTGIPTRTDEETIQELTELLRQRPINTNKLPSLDWDPSIDIRTHKYLRDPGFASVPFLKVEAPYPDLLQALGHEGRHRAHATERAGFLDQLVRLVPDSYKNADDLVEAASNPATDLYGEAYKGGRGGPLVGNLDRLLKILGLAPAAATGALSLIPENGNVEPNTP